MKYYDLLTDEQKKIVNENCELKEIEIYGFKILIGKNVFLIIKENKVIYFYYDDSIKRIFASKNDKYKLINFELYPFNEDENYEEILFDCNDESFLTFEYINDTNY